MIGFEGKAVIDGRDRKEEIANFYGDIHAIGFDATQEIDKSARGNVVSAQSLGFDSEFFKGKICLDAGCGGVNDQIRTMVKQNARRVVGVDLSMRNLKNDRNNYSKDILEGKVGFVQADIMSLPFGQEAFDFVCCNGVLAHTYDPMNFVKELVRVLKPGGFLFLNVYGKGGLIRLFEKIIRFLHMKFVPISLAKKVYEKFFPSYVLMNILDALYTPIENNYYARDVVRFFEGAALTDIRRLADPNYHRTKFGWLLFPQANNYRSLYSRVMFGSGYISLIGKKST